MTRSFLYLRAGKWWLTDADGRRLVRLPWRPDDRPNGAANERPAAAVLPLEQKEPQDANP